MNHYALARQLPTCNRALKPGGWIDCAEPGAFFESYYGTIGPDHCYKLWEKVMIDSGNESGMPFHVGPFIKQRLEDAGFINIVEKKVCVTIGKWSSDPWEREVGVWEQLRLERGVQHFCERRCINNLGVSFAICSETLKTEQHLVASRRGHCFRRTDEIGTQE